MALAQVSLEDKYQKRSGQIYLTGLQALVRLPMLQRDLDAEAAIQSAGFISGYRGSPLGGLDQNLWQARKFLAARHIHFQPGINEDLAATAVWGSQQTQLFGDHLYDGVFAMWYGKGPGVDRSGDVLRHGNLAGSAGKGGVLLIAGDDHTCKSSTTAHQTEFAFMDAGIPVLHPAGVGEFVEFGLFGWALSRFSGCWVAFKTVSDTVDSSTSVNLDLQRMRFDRPEDFRLPAGGLNIRWPDPALDQEARLHQFKLPAAQAFARTNRIDRAVWRSPEKRLGIVTCGKSYLDVRQALDELGLKSYDAGNLGIGLYKVGMVWPLEPEGIRHFASGFEDILVVEEKRALIETQLKEILYHLPVAERPRVVGKQDERGTPLLPITGELTPSMIARAILSRLGSGSALAPLRARLKTIEDIERHYEKDPAPIHRLPYFCSGCPHNRSTEVPEGSRAVAGIGCHYMVQWMDRHTDTFTQMGGEGVSWIGQAPFSKTRHVFQNLGDGTYFHSGILGIRAAIAAEVNITFKILYNDAVAMTGGQPVDGHLDVPSLVRQLIAEGVKSIAILSDQPEKYDGADLPADIAVHDRKDLDNVQKAFRELPGTTAIIYDQTCAAEKRRRRKRGLMDDPPKRVFINKDVCEGCGDCGVKSNCLSIIPVETELGRKRAIDQSSCNKDYSCLDGFCPSFVTVHGGNVRTHSGLAESLHAESLPKPETPPLTEAYSILITGVGGTGVVTIGALLGMAAHLEGISCSVMDMTGLAQKGGAVFSHVRLAKTADELHAVRIASGGAHLLLGCDKVVAASGEALSKIRRGKSHAVINTHETMTGAFTHQPDLEFPGTALGKLIEDATGVEGCAFLDASAIAASLLGDTIGSNLLLLGYAYQRGYIPLSAAAIEEAIRLNGVAVEANWQAFRWGRQAALDLPGLLDRLRKAVPAMGEEEIAHDLQTVIARRMDYLSRYQDRAYADRYRSLVSEVERKEAAVAAPGRTHLTEAVARNYFKVLAYKDEYEVARLYTDGRFQAALKEQFSGNPRLQFHLAPPLLARRDPATGGIRKRSFGPWMMGAFRLLAKGRKLRGTWLDPFAYTADRKLERQMIRDYERLISELLHTIRPDNYTLAVELASLQDQVRGFGHVKEAQWRKTCERKTALLTAFHAMTPTLQAAE